MIARRGVRGALALVAVLAAVAAAAVDAGESPSREVGGDEGVVVGAVAAEVARPTPSLPPLELARRLRDGEPATRVVDVRARDAYDAGHLPTARHLDRNRLDDLDRVGGATVVIYDDLGDTEDVALALRLLGHDDVRSLRGGLRAWTRQVMAPVLPYGADGPLTAAWDSAAVLSLYFGGAPRRAGPATPEPPEWSLPDSLPDAARPRERGGCGW